MGHAMNRSKLFVALFLSLIVESTAVSIARCSSHRHVLDCDDCQKTNITICFLNYCEASECAPKVETQMIQLALDHVNKDFPNHKLQLQVADYGGKFSLVTQTSQMMAQTGTARCVGVIGAYCDNQSCATECSQQSVSDAGQTKNAFVPTSAHSRPLISYFSENTNLQYALGIYLSLLFWRPIIISIADSGWFARTCFSQVLHCFGIHL